MAIRLDHTIVAARDRDASALFLTEVLGLPPPRVLGHFAVVRIGDTSLDFIDVREYMGVTGHAGSSEIASQHYAFLVSEAEFDAAFARIRERRLPYWADPGHHEPDRINVWDDGRGVYFDDPNGHNLEILTRPYGSAGTTASAPHPLVMRELASPPDARERRGLPPGNGARARADAERPDLRQD